MELQTKALAWDEKTLLRTTLTRRQPDRSRRQSKRVPMPMQHRRLLLQMRKRRAGFLRPRDRHPAQLNYRVLRHFRTEGISDQLPAEANPHHLLSSFQRGANQRAFPLQPGPVAILVKYSSRRPSPSASQSFPARAGNPHDKDDKRRWRDRDLSPTPRSLPALQKPHVAKRLSSSISKQPRRKLRLVQSTISRGGLSPIVRQMELHLVFHLELGPTGITRMVGVPNLNIGPDKWRAPD